MKKRRLRKTSLKALNLLNPAAGTGLQFAKIVFSTVLGLLLLPVVSKATHIVGGEIGYKCLGGNQYEITLTVYRDCDTGEAPFDDPAYIGIYDGANNLVKTLQIQFMADDTLSGGVFDTCLVAPSNICVHRSTYRSVTTLAPDPVGGFYDITYVRCCRNGTIVNINDPLFTGAVYDIMLTEEAMRQCNSSPVINEWPPIFICVNTPIAWDHSASDNFDAVNDSIVYTLCTPSIGGTVDDPKPIPPENPPPFDTLVWKQPIYSLQNLMGIGDPRIGEPLKIDRKTGLLTGIPTIQGQFVVGVCIEEYDRESRKLLSRTRRDFQYNVGICMDELTFDVNAKDCSEDLATYSIEFNTNAPVLSSNIGTIERVSGDNYVIRGIAVGDTVRVSYSNNSGICALEETILSPNCTCEEEVTVNPPVIVGDITTCAGDTIGPLTAIVESGQTIDWYDAPTGGNLLAAGTSTFTPSVPGTYYAEARIINNGCTSLTRTPATLVINELPEISLTSEGAMCADDLLSYSVSFSTNASDIMISSGNLVDNGGGNYVVEVVDISLNLTITLDDTATGCTRQETIMTPNCSCDMVDVSPPVSGGDLTVCAGDPMASLSVNVADGETADWYDASINGNLLASSTTIFTPPGPGTYYAEARVVMNDCTSPERTAITIAINELPTFSMDLEGAMCALDLQSYRIVFMTDADSVLSTGGTVLADSNGVFQVNDIPVGENITLTIIDTDTGCELIREVTAPECNCENENVAPPVSGGDLSGCTNEAIPALTAGVEADETVDWYDAPTGGTLLAEGDTSFIPPGPGIYYAETRMVVNDCISSSRTPVELTINEAPTFMVSAEAPQCAPDLLSYSVVFSTDADDISVNSGSVNSNGDGSFVVSGITADTNLIILLSSTVTGCSREETVEAPNCECESEMISPPVSGGDLNICVGDTIPPFTVMVEDGATADWYDTETEGNPLASGTLEFTPDGPGTYYAETRIVMSGCTSLVRTPVTLAINEIPSFTLNPNGAVCAEDLLTYSVVFNSNAEDVSTNAGMVTSNGDGNYTVSAIDPAIDLTITLANTSTGCGRAETIAAPTCTCDSIVVDPPVLEGNDVVVCADEPIPALVATVADGTTVDWYDAETGGNLLAEGSTSFTPSAGGTYYAEARMVTNNCTSATRSAITLTVNVIPTFELSAENPACAMDLQSYTVNFDTDATNVETDNGTLADNGNGNFTVSGIPLNTSLTITLRHNDTNCDRSETVMAPNCDCELFNIEAPASGGDVEICAGDDVPSLMVTVNDGETADWYDMPTGGNLLAEGTASFQPPGAGTYYAEARMEMNDCTSGSRTPVTLTVNELPDFSFTGDGPECASDFNTYSFGFTTGADDVTVTAGTLAGNGNSFVVNAVPKDVGVTITLTNTVTGCSRVQIVEAPSCECEDTMIEAPVSGGDATICEGDPIPAVSATVANGFLTVDWYDAATGGTLLMSGSNTFTPPAGGTYYAEARHIDNGCTSSSRTPVTVNVSLLPTFTLDSTATTCNEDGLSYDIVFNTDGDDIQVSSGILVDNGNGNYRLTNILRTQNITITVESTATGCMRTAQVDAPDCMCIGIEIEPPVADNDNIVTCESDPVPMLVAIVPSGITVDWYDRAEDGNLLLANSLVFVPDTAGVYFAEARQMDGECTSNVRTPFTWTLLPFPSFSTDASGPQCESNQQTYRVLFSTDAEIVEVSNGILEELGQGDYEVTEIPVDEDLTITMNNENSPCERVETVTAPECSVICEEPYIFVPSGFTPNSDGNNDTFRVRSEVIESLKLIVYNRWGEEIFVADSQSKEWDGTFKGDRLPPDVYGYHVSAVCFGGETFSKKGNVTLLR